MGEGALRCKIRFPAFLSGCGSCENTIRGCTLLLLIALLLGMVITTATTSYCELTTSCVPGTEHHLYHFAEFSPGPRKPGGYFSHFTEQTLRLGAMVQSHRTA